MNENRKIRELVAYLLVMIAGAPSLLVVVPVIMVTNAREYVDEYFEVPDILSENSFVSVSTAFASAGGIALNSLSAAVDGVSETSLSPYPLLTPIGDSNLPPVEERNKIDLNHETQKHE
ncbi:hypothetical protein [Haloarcula brevis]|uniref:hypothetical protein n=1 Tax=Haloarcula brevis TaxID=3111453 RepID=UPI00300E89A1